MSLTALNSFVWSYLLNEIKTILIATTNKKEEEFWWSNPCIPLLWQMYVTCTVQAKGTRLAKPVLSLGLMCLAFLTGLNRVAEYRNHWSDVIAGFIIGTAIATFLVRLIVCLRRTEVFRYGECLEDIHSLFQLLMYFIYYARIQKRIRNFSVDQAVNFTYTFTFAAR